MVKSRCAVTVAFMSFILELFPIVGHRGASERPRQAADGRAWSRARGENRAGLAARRGKICLAHPDRNVLALKPFVASIRSVQLCALRRRSVLDVWDNPTERF